MERMGFNVRESDIVGLYKRNYTDKETVITAENLNEIQDAILDLEDGLFSVDNDKSGDVITITDAAKRGFRSLNIYGKTTQDGTPTPDAPVDLVSAGDNGSINIAVVGENIFQFIGKATVENGTIIESSSVGSTFQGNDGTSPGSTSWSSGWAHFDRTVPLYLRQGTVITVSADYIVLEKHSSAKDKVSIIFNSHSGPSALNMKDAEIGVKYRISRTLVVPEDGQYKRTTFSTHSSKVKIENVQWEIGDVVSDFVPYNEQSIFVSTPNGLPGIPVASGGNYTDSNGKQWVCDEIDFARGVYVQRIKELEFNGSENWSLYTAQNIYYGLGILDVLDGPYARTPGMCNQFAVRTTASTEENAAWLGVNNAVVFLLTREWYDKGVSAWKEHLSTNPLHIVYKIATPIETPLTEDELAAYSALHTYKNHTTVFNDAGAYMELEYVMDAKKYIDSLIGTGGSGGTIIPATVE